MDRSPGGGNTMLRLGLGAAALGLVMLHNPVDASPAPGPTTTARTSPAASASAAAASAPAKAAPAKAAPTPSAPPRPTAPAVHPLGAARPTRVRIPQIGVNAPVGELTLDAAGHLQAPPANNRNLVGWYRDGASPGETGSAVLAGHVDTRTGPAVFLLLRMLIPGAEVDVARADGTTAVFTVDSVETFAKNAFPDDRVYQDTPDAQLRLITCGGAYDRRARDYQDNVVVFAHLTSTRQA